MGLMCCQNFWKRMLAFSITFLLSAFVVSSFQKWVNPSITKEISLKSKTIEVIREGNGFCSASHYVDNREVSYAYKDGKKPSVDATTNNLPVTPLQIISKPKPSYTDVARQNQVMGKVRLRVTFLASGEIGSVSTVSGLQDGLTEQAIAAAKQIRFKPAQAKGVPQTVTKQVEYSFSIY